MEVFFVKYWHAKYLIHSSIKNTKKTYFWRRIYQILSDFFGYTKTGRMGQFLVYFCSLKSLIEQCSGRWDDTHPVVHRFDESAHKERVFHHFSGFALVAHGPSCRRIVDYTVLSLAQSSSADHILLFWCLFCTQISNLTVRIQDIDSASDIIFHSEIRPCHFSILSHLFDHFFVDFSADIPFHTVKDTDSSFSVSKQSTQCSRWNRFFETGHIEGEFVPYEFYADAFSVGLHCGGKIEFCRGAEVE